MAAGKDKRTIFKKTVVKSSGLKWLTLALSWRFPFSERYFALPFMTVLEHSIKIDKTAKKKNKTTLTVDNSDDHTNWSLVYTPINVIGNGGFAWLCLKLKIGLITRLKMNARLYDFPSIDEPCKRGRKKQKERKSAQQ